MRLAAALLTAMPALGAFAEEPETTVPVTAEGAAPAAGAPQAVVGEPDDTAIDPIQPDFTVVTLPTTLRLPRHGVAFRVTHRFTRPLGQGDLGDLAADFFGFDSGAQVGLELRFGLFSGTQLGVNRTSDRTIQLFAQQSLLRQGPRPVGLAAYLTFEGLDNLQEQRSFGLALVLSRTLGSRLAVYAVPAWVGDTNLEDFPGEDEGTLMVGLGGRLRLGKAYALVGEVVPRLAGYEHAGTHMTFGFERRVGGHGFQINFSNSLGTTLVQVARGGGALRRAPSAEGDPWYIGFNISRKFY
ncbi:MAG TPA: DUF5777 family beta-barrel protein [Vicinamibacteria bacterium]|nr:DUF5777 family beta-barrel protein [Vicinamibacteria bacterium]